MIKQLKFFSEIDCLSNCFISIMPLGIKSVDTLQQNLVARLAFPEPYRDTNWNFIRDNLMEFDWIKDYQIVLINQELPKLSEKDKVHLKIYLEILCEASSDWERYNSKHKFIVVFPDELKPEIYNLLTLDENLDT